MHVDYYITRNSETGIQKMVIIFAGGSVRTVENSHPEFHEVKELMDSGEATAEEVLALIDAPITELNERLIAVTDRISVSNGHLLIDGDIAENAVTEHILRMLEDGDNDYLRVAKFYENLLQNPSVEAREGLYDWLNAQGMFSLDENGYVLGYKGITEKSTSRWGGIAYVDGNLVRGKVEYNEGSVVTMPRSEVCSDRKNACAPGLHVGTFEYACNFGAKVAFNPRDVVSVPERETQKLRTCRLAVLEITENPTLNESTKFEGRRFYVEEGIEDDDYYDEDYDDFDY